MQSDTYTTGMRLVDAALRSDHETTLADWLQARLDRGDSYEAMARELTDLLAIPGLSISYGSTRRWSLRLDLVKESAS